MSWIYQFLYRRVIYVVKDMLTFGSRCYIGAKTSDEILADKLRGYQITADHDVSGTNHRNAGLIGTCFERGHVNSLRPTSHVSFVLRSIGRAK
jgi:hypothetical protein